MLLRSTRQRGRSTVCTPGTLSWMHGIPADNLILLAAAAEGHPYRTGSAESRGQVSARCPR
jgi:hypothetical protein